ncbi:MAG: NfeD family protein [Planctomycetes bacterium]|jgi:membrane protein implicated in regulation of membrane protease activity|nr:NfeD family protein [Planctomycetota bacterium]
MESAFLVCFYVGLFFTIASAFLATVFGGHDAQGGDADAGGVDVGHDGPDVTADHDFDHSAADTGTDGHADVGIGDSFPGLTPWSPTVICSFLTTFGGVGYLALAQGSFGIPGSLLAGTAAGFLLAAGVLWSMNRLFAALQSSSEVRVADLIGEEGEIITPIPEQGAGEVSYESRGTRLSAPARSVSGKPIPRAARVRIARIAGTMYYVEPL